MNFTKCNTKVILHPYIYSEFCYSSYFTLVSLIIILSTDIPNMIRRRFFSVTANACYPLPTTTKQDMKKYGVSEEFVNRNPRNLEMLGIAHKRRGWKFQAPRKDFYHELTLYREGQHTVAKLIHSSGKCIVRASTKESAISQQLPSTTDVNACYNIGRVIAHRCHQVGIDSMMFVPDGSGEAVKRFEEALLSSGIQLEEIDEEPYRDYEIGTDYDTASPS
ncbi:MRPL18 [Bugula neritina]|uniref:Large ribosomal subunit protein uL18m n=1 Tax=Bugula neritina TaxID=10212 RepID=A0A7J7JXB2_BUGNE|nr:MRPL18 [Bugula neritina]